MFELGLLKIPVSDVTRSAEFYRKLGFTEEFVVAEYGWAQFTVGELPLGLYVPGKGGGNRQPGGSVDFHLTVADLNEFHGAIGREGVTPPEGIVTSDDGLAFLEVSDPDGNVLKFLQR